MALAGFVLFNVSIVINVVSQFLSTDENEANATFVGSDITDNLIPGPWPIHTRYV